MSDTAQGGSNGIVPAGPSNTYDGVYPCSDMDGNTDGDMTPNIRTSPAPEKPTSWPLGNVPD